MNDDIITCVSVLEDVYQIGLWLYYTAIPDIVISVQLIIHFPGKYTFAWIVITNAP